MVNSEWGDILQALEAKMVANVAGNPTVCLRRRTQMVEGDPLPLVIIAPDDSGEDMALETFCNEVTWGYRVNIACYMACNRDLNIDFDWLAWRQQIRNLVFAPLDLPDGSTVDWEVNTGGPFVQSSMDQNVQVSTFSAIYRVGATRK
jgi:hypothetical protein